MIEYLLRNSVPSNKLVVGIAAHGRTFSLASSTDTGVGAAVDTSRQPTAGNFSGRSGYLTYLEVNILEKYHTRTHYALLECLAS